MHTLYCIFDGTESSINAVLKTDAQQFDSTMVVQHCPSNFGCRALLNQPDGVNYFPVNENFTITFNVSTYYYLHFFSFG